MRFSETSRAAPGDEMKAHGEPTSFKRAEASPSRRRGARPIAPIACGPRRNSGGRSEPEEQRLQQPSDRDQRVRRDDVLADRVSWSEEAAHVLGAPVTERTGTWRELLRSTAPPARRLRRGSRLSAAAPTVDSARHDAPRRGPRPVRAARRQCGALPHQGPQHRDEIKARDARPSAEAPPRLRPAFNPAGIAGRARERQLLSLPG